jgi:hypothetical protein
VVLGAETAPAIPPWCEHAPRPDLLVVPSVHVTFAATVALLAVRAAAVAFLSTPPWSEQAPRPLAAEVVPSLQIVASVACAHIDRGGETNAIAARMSDAQDCDRRRLIIFEASLRFA